MYVRAIIYVPTYLLTTYPLTTYLSTNYFTNASHKYAHAKAVRNAKHEPDMSTSYDVYIHVHIYMYIGA